MNSLVTDFHLHSYYSRAVSPQMMLPAMAETAKQKGIHVVATGDWTHPLWLREIRNQLEESEEGVFRLKGKGKRGKEEKEVQFLLSVEIATIYSQGGKGRRIHQLIFVPSFETAEKVNKELVKRGCNLTSDGRPIIGLSSKNLLSLLLEIDARSLLIPAHVWTPWFGIYGQRSGFDSLEEAFEDLAPFVYGIETGLSSDPEMNWQKKELDTRSILSFSDAHSLSKIGREATVFQLERVSYEHIRQAIMQPSEKNQEAKAKHYGKNKVLYTIEFYPEEGKYHYSGHRNCHISQTPEEQRMAQSICPVCGRKVTDGVMRRVQELADEKPRGQHNAGAHHVVWIIDPHNIHPPFVKIVPLQEIISQALKRPGASPKVRAVFDMLCKKGESEFALLLQTPLEKLIQVARLATTREEADKIAEGIQKVREELIAIKPGYDGVYGTVTIWPEKSKPPSTQASLEL